MTGIELSLLHGSDPASHITPLTDVEFAAFRDQVNTFAKKLQDAGVRFGHPPFILPETPTPETLAADITHCFYKLIDIEGPALSLTWRIATAFAMNTPELQDLRSAGERIAADYDRGVNQHLSFGYHTRQHAIESLFCAHILALIERRIDHALFPEARLILMLATMMHTWGHDGSRTDPATPFYHEKRALKFAAPYLDPVLSEEQAEKLKLILFATDTVAPLNVTRNIVHWHTLCLNTKQNGTPDKTIVPPPVIPAGIEDLAPLLLPEHRQTAEMALILADADALPLFGLTTDYAVLNSRALQDEWARPIKQKHYLLLLHEILGRPRRKDDKRAKLSFEQKDFYIGFSSSPGQFFAPNLADIILGHGALLEEMGETDDDDTLDDTLDALENSVDATGSRTNVTPAESSSTAAPPRTVQFSLGKKRENTIDLSYFTEAKNEISTTITASTPTNDTLTSPENITTLRQTLEKSGFFDNPPFTLDPNTQDANIRLGIIKETADSLIRLHTVTGPLLSAVTDYLFEKIGLKLEDPVFCAAMGIAKEIDRGIGAGTLDDKPENDRNPYHNRFHIIDLVLLCDLLGQRATQRKAPASSPLARGLLLLSALVCHWHHTGRGNRIDGEYLHFYMQDRACMAAERHTRVMSKELRQSLEILVRSTDPHRAYTFARKAYSYHVGLDKRPDIPAGCESLARLLGDPALCTLCARLNDAIYIPFVGLGNAFSARSMVQLGRETNTAIDFNFVRHNLVAPLLSRPLYHGEHPPKEIMLGRNKVASFTSAEAQALFNPSLHALLVTEAKTNSATEAPH